MQVGVISNRWKVVMGNKCGTPDSEEVIDSTMQEVSFSVEDLCELKSFSGYKRGPIINRLGR